MLQTRIHFRAWLSDLTPEEVQWILGVVELVNHPNGTDPGRQGELVRDIQKLCAFTGCSTEILARTESDGGSKTSRVVFESFGQHDPLAVSLLIQDFFERFRPLKATPFELHYVKHEGRPEQALITGGVVVVTRDRVDGHTTHDLVVDLIERCVHLVEVEGAARREAWAFRSRALAEQTATCAVHEAVAGVAIASDLLSMSAWSEIRPAYLALRSERPGLPAIDIRRVAFDEERESDRSAQSARPLASIQRLRTPKGDGLG